MNKHVFPSVLPATVSIAKAFFAAAVTDTVTQLKFADERTMFQVVRDIPYVSQLLLHSSLLGLENPFGLWGSDFVGGSEIEIIERRLEQGMMRRAEAQNVADQLLIRFGLFHRDRRLWPLESSRLKNCGSRLYRQAAEIHRPPVRDQLESMSDNFIPWTEVLRDMQRRELIPLLM